MLWRRRRRHLPDGAIDLLAYSSVRQLPAQVGPVLVRRDLGHDGQRRQEVGPDGGGASPGPSRQAVAAVLLLGLLQQGVQLRHDGGHRRRGAGHVVV